MTRQALGKGLDALLPRGRSVGASLLEVDVELIRPNALQPRALFDPEQLEELADSIRINGLLQPIVLRQKGAATYEIIAGERRWRAAQKAGLQKVPALIHNVSDQKMLELALVENIQRADLSAIEEAHAYQLLLDQFDLTQEQVAERVGRSRAAVANTLRLLRLPSSLQKEVISGNLSMGHARALIPLPPKAQQQLARLILQQGLSVRQTEHRARTLLEPAGPRVVSRPDPNLRAAAERLEVRWKTRVEIRQRGSRGQILLHFASQEELDRIFDGLLDEALDP